MPKISELPAESPPATGSEIVPLVGGGVTKRLTVDQIAQYALSGITGLLNYRGVYNASGNVFPSTGGSGSSGAIKKADFWIVSVAGTLGGTPVAAGDWVIAKQDAPGSTAGNWSLIEHDIGYTPANDASVIHKTGTESKNGRLHTPDQPEYWGADPTGVADSTTACLQAAAYSGGTAYVDNQPTITLGPGTFKVNLAGLDRIFLVGAGSDLTTLIPASATSPIIDAGGAGNYPDQVSFVDKVRITTGGVDRPYQYPLVRFTLTRNQGFGTDVWFDVAPYVVTCVHLEGAYQVRWRGVRFRTGRYGIPVEFANATTLPGTGGPPQCDTDMFDMQVDGTIGGIFRQGGNEVHGLNFFTKVVQTTYYASGAPSEHTALSGAYSAGATSFTVADATGIVAADLLVLDPGLNECEPVKVASVSGTTITLDSHTPLRFDHPSLTEVFRGGVCFSFADAYNSIKFHEFHSEGQQLGVAVGNVHNLTMYGPYKGCGRLVHLAKDATEIHIYDPVMEGTANLNELVRRSSNNSGSNFDGQWECQHPNIPAGAPHTPALPNGSNAGGDYFPHGSKNWELKAKNGSGAMCTWRNVGSGNGAQKQLISMVSGVETGFITHGNGASLRGRLSKAAGYTLLPTDPDVLGITDTTAPRTIILPAANAVAAGKTFTVVDESAGAGTNNITIQAAGADTISGGATSTTALVAANNGNRKLYSDGVSKWIVESAGYTAENVANKTNDTTLAADSATLYPTEHAVKGYVDAAVTSLLDYRAGYDASGNAFPSAGGSGAAGAILKADFWIVTVAGTLGGTAVTPGDWVVAKVDAPGSTAGNWDLIEHDLGYSPENAANKTNDTTLAADSATLYPTEHAVKGYADGKAPLVAAAEDAWQSGTTSVNGVTYAIGTVVVDQGVRWIDSAGGTSATAPSLDVTGRWVPLTVSAGAAAPRRSMVPNKQIRKIVANFASHSWTSGGATGSADLASTANPAPGFSQNVRLVTGGTGGSRTLLKTGLTPIDMTGRQHSILIYVTNVAHLTQLSFEFGDTAFTNFWRTYVQSSVLANNTSWIPEGAWVQVDMPWHIDATTGTPNRAAITALQITVIDDNTGNPVTIDVQDFGSIPASTALPHGAVVADLDDGFASHFTFALPLLSSLGIAANIFPICDSIDTAGKMTTAQLQTLQNEFGWYIGVHALTTANHTAGLPALTPAQRDADLRGARAFNAVRGLGTEHYAHPQGQSTPAVDALVKEYFLTGRMGPLTREVIPAANPLRVRSLTFLAASSEPAFEAIVDDAYANGYMLRIVNHDIVASGATGFAVTQANYSAFWNYVAAKGIPVLTLPQLIAITTTPVATPLAKVTGAGTAAAVNTGTGGADVPTTAQADGRYWSSLSLVSGHYYRLPNATLTTASGNALANGTFRAAPWRCPTTCTLVKIGAETTVIGDIGCHYRLGIYPDVNGRPSGLPLLDAGQIAGDVVAVQEITVSTALTAGTRYHPGGVVQDVTSVQPTLRLWSVLLEPDVQDFGTTIPGAGNDARGISFTGATGALPTTGTIGLTSIGASIFGKVTVP